MLPVGCLAATLEKSDTAKRRMSFPALEIPVIEPKIPCSSQTLICYVGAFAAEIGSSSLNFSKFPVNFPVSREIALEDWFRLAAAATTQSSETRN